MKNTNNINWENLAQEYLETGISLTKMSEKYGTTRHILTNRFKKLGIDIVNRQNEVKFCETIFDSIDTEEKAYWLGFIFADGYISSYKEAKEKSRYMLEISLKGSDKPHLDKFNEFVKHKNKQMVKISDAKCGDIVTTRCRWFVANKHLWTVLESYGCVPNKSLVLKFPSEEIFKDKSLIRHFIRGYFDGDGCFSRNLHKLIVSPNASILGTPEFLDKVEEYSNISGRRELHSNGITEYIWYRLDETVKFINYIYSNANIYLERKYKLYQFFKNGSRSLQEWNEFQQIENGEVRNSDPVVNSEIKESELPYSVETEPSSMEE